MGPGHISPVNGAHRHTELPLCYAPMGRIVRRVGSGCEVVLGLQFGVSQVLSRAGLETLV